MKNLAMVSMLVASLALGPSGQPIEEPRDRPFDPEPQHVQPQATASPIPIPDVGKDLAAVLPYRPDVVHQAVLRLKAFKGISDDQYRADPGVVLENMEDLGRLLAYMAIIDYSNGNTQWAILLYCQAIKADPRYLSLDAVPLDTDPSFLTGLQVIRLEALKYFAGLVSHELKMLPSKIPPSPSVDPQQR